MSEEYTVNELYDQGQQEAAEAQAEAERWADEQGMTHWSDGTPRANEDSGESEQGDLVEETQTETPESDCGDVEQTTEEQNDQLTEQEEDVVQPADNTEPMDANTEQQDDNVVEEQNDQLTEQVGESNSEVTTEEPQEFDGRRAEIRQVGCETFDDPVEADDAQLSSLREQYERYGDQIAQLSREKEYYPADGKEWNLLMDEKIAAQNQVFERINELTGRRNRLLAERENKNN